jgi:hypothetical protein
MKPVSITWRSVGLLIVAGLGCGGGLEAGSYDGGNSGSDGRALGGGGRAGTGGMGGNGGGADGATSGGQCADKPLQSTCGTIQCGATWTAAQTRGALPGPIDYGMGHYRRASCGSINAIEVSGADTSVIYYFDATTGELAAVFDVGLGGEMSCIGGASTFASPTCGSFVEVPLASGDGGQG